MPADIGIWEILILAVVLLIVFGPSRLPEMGRQLGRGIREFKGSVLGDDDDPLSSMTDSELPVAPRRMQDRDSIS